MLIFVIIMLLVIFTGFKATGENQFNKDYISYKQTNAINGIFVLLVFFSHACAYATYNGVLDGPYQALRGHLGQMIVVPFLFYSGYGIMESIKKKGTDYIKQIPGKRFLRVFYHYDIAVFLFLLLNLYLGNELKLKRTLLAFTTWTSIGNSNWYITAALGLYLITFVAFIIARKHHYIGAILTTALSVAFVYWQITMNREAYCYNTIILYAVGMWYSLLKDKIERIVQKSDLIYFFVCALVGCAYWYSFNHRKDGVEWHSVWGVLFMALVVLITMKFSINNEMLQWLGKHTFSVYILQRMPMLILKDLGIAATNKYAFIVISFVLTVFIAELFDRAMAKLDGFIYKPRKNKASEIAQ